MRNPKYLSIWLIKRSLEKESLFQQDRYSAVTGLRRAHTLKGLEVPLFWKKKEVNIENRLNAILDVLFNGIVKK